jgi:DNA-binding NtrC family response regulator
MATTRTQQSQYTSPPALTVLVVDKDDDIGDALQDLLQLAGYSVTLVEDMSQAEALIEASLEPLLLIVGNADTVDYTGLQHFTVVATNPLAQTAYVYFTVIPERSQIPGLVQMLIQQADSTVDLPYELAYLLAVVATAAAQAHPDSVHLGGSSDRKAYDTTQQ